MEAVSSAAPSVRGSSSPVRSPLHLHGWWFDERCDIIASTYAAANYRADLYGIWGGGSSPSPRTTAAYHVAPGRAPERDFWTRSSLQTSASKFWPRSVMREKYGFTIPVVEPLRFDLVTVGVPTDLDVVARSAGTTTEIIREMNPQLKRGATPPMMEVHVKVPRGAGEACALALTNLPPSERVAWTEHKVSAAKRSRIASEWNVGRRAARHHQPQALGLPVSQIVVVPVPGGARAGRQLPSYMNPAFVGSGPRRAGRYARPRRCLGREGGLPGEKRRR
jgi:hypothetical protein